MHTRPWWRSEKYDGDVERSLRKYSVIMTIISLVLRIFIFFAFWKMSIDYYKNTNEQAADYAAIASDKFVYLRGGKRNV